MVSVATESGLLLTVMSDVIAHRLWRFGRVSMPEGVVGGEVYTRLTPPMSQHKKPIGAA